LGRFGINIRIHAQLQNYFANHVYRIFKDKTIINTINPSGLVIKNDLTFDELIYAFNKIINNEQYAIRF
jgi:ribosome-interacting GTPase 1